MPDHRATFDHRAKPNYRAAQGYCADANYRAAQGYWPLLAIVPRATMESNGAGCPAGLNLG